MIMMVVMATRSVVVIVTTAEAKDREGEGEGGIDAEDMVAIMTVETEKKEGGKESGTTGALKTRNRRRGMKVERDVPTDTIEDEKREKGIQPNISVWAATGD